MTTYEAHLDSARARVFSHTSLLLDEYVSGNHAGVCSYSVFRDLRDAFIVFCSMTTSYQREVLNEQLLTMCELFMSETQCYANDFEPLQTLCAALRGLEDDTVPNSGKRVLMDLYPDEHIEQVMGVFAYEITDLMEGNTKNLPILSRLACEPDGSSKLASLARVIFSTCENLPLTKDYRGFNRACISGLLEVFCLGRRYSA